MKIGINATVFKNPVTGVAKRLISLMIECHHPTIRYYLFAPCSFQLPVALKALPCEIIVTPSWSEWQWLHFKLPQLLMQYKVNLFEAPWGGGLPYPNFITKHRFSNIFNTTPHAKNKAKDHFHSTHKKPTFIFTLHDLIPLQTCGTLGRWRFSSKLRRQLIITDIVVVVSPAIKQELLAFIEKHFKSTASQIIAKIFLSPNGVNHELFHQPLKKTTTKTNSFNLNDSDLPQKIKEIMASSNHSLDAFVFYTGGFNSRKNLLPLIKSFSEKPLPDTTNPKITNSRQDKKGVTLLLAGKENNYFQKKLAPTIKEVNQGIKSKESTEPRIISLGYIDEETLAWCYQHCALFIYPSKLEGFGMPVLEALACGAMVMIRENISDNFPEFKSAVESHPFTSPKDIANRIQTLLQQQNLHSSTKNNKKTTSQKQNELIANYTWKRIGEDYYQNCYRIYS